MAEEIKPIYFIDGKNEKKDKKIIDFISNKFLKDTNGTMNRKIMAKVRTRMQLGFLNSTASAVQSGNNNFAIEVRNIEQLNDAINKKVTKEMEKYIGQLYQEEFEKIGNLK